MNRPGSLGFLQSTSDIVKGVKIIFRIDPYASNMLHFRGFLQAFLNQQPRSMSHYRTLNDATILPQEMQFPIEIQHLFIEIHTSCSSDSQTRIHHRSSNKIFRYHFAHHLHTHKCTLLNDIVYRPDDFNISIKIDTSIVIQNPKSSIIAHKRVFPNAIGFGSIRNNIDIKVILIPLPNLIVGHILAPTLNTLHCTFRQRIPPKPAIMYYFRYLFRHLIMKNNRKDAKEAASSSF